MKQPGKGELVSTFASPKPDRQTELAGEYTSEFSGNKSHERETKVNWKGREYI